LDYHFSMTNHQLRIPVLLSILAALVTFALKGLGYLLTGSVGVLSDAAEAAVNLFASLMAYYSLWYAAQPVDTEHTYGHEKIEFFSSGLEGILILGAAISIVGYAVIRLLARQPYLEEQLGVGTVLVAVAAVINLIVAVILLRASKVHRSIVLEADGKHLMTDVWASGAVIIGLILVTWTGRQELDPLVAILVAVSFAWTGYDLVRRSFNGLMDHALPVEEQEAVRAAIASRLETGMDFHALRTRQAGSQRFADFHLLVPGSLSVDRAHALAAGIEDAIRAALPGIEITVHIEPIEEKAAYEDSALVPLEQAARQAQSDKHAGERGV
jgi:cation diffusion facilitator family transporter